MSFANYKRGLAWLGGLPAILAVCGLLGTSNVRADDFDDVQEDVVQEQPVDLTQPTPEPSAEPDDLPLGSSEINSAADAVDPGGYEDVPAATPAPTKKKAMAKSRADQKKAQGKTVAAKKKKAATAKAKKLVKKGKNNKQKKKKKS